MFHSLSRTFVEESVCFGALITMGDEFGEERHSLLGTIAGQDHICLNKWNTSVFVSDKPPGVTSQACQVSRNLL